MGVQSFHPIWWGLIYNRVGVKHSPHQIGLRKDYVGLISSRFQWDWPSRPTLFSILFCAEYLLQLSVWWLYPAWINTQTYCFIKIFLFFIICLEHCRWLNTEIFTTNDTAGMPTCKQNDCVWNGIKCHHIWKVDLIRC